MSIEPSSSFGSGSVWHVTAIRSSDNSEITTRLFQEDAPSRERCARALLGVLNGQGVASPPMIRGFGDIALLRVHGYEIVGVQRAADGDGRYASLLSARPVAVVGSRA